MTAEAAVPPRIRPVADSALLIEFEPVIDPAVNARTIAVASAVRHLDFAGVRDIVSTYRTVAVYFDPLGTDLPALTAAVAQCASVVGEVAHGRLLEVPVVYGGDDGPDLDSVAAWGSLTREEVVERHTQATYRVFMLGFLPGFAYMGVVDPAIAAPRREIPRLRVPAGSVGIAGQQTGIYPRTSPGGWQIIGRTDMAVFDPRAVPAARFAPGDRVRFIRHGAGAREVSSGSVTDSPASGTEPDNGAHALVEAPGLFTTVQDLGRWGHQSVGVPVAGAMDAASHCLANLLVGNDEQAATLEATLAGPELRFAARTTVAIAGADLGAMVDQHPVAPGAVAMVNDGSVLRFSGRRSGARAYIAIAGGVMTGPVLGSRSTHTLSELGGLQGRALKRGDRVPFRRTGNASARTDVRIVRRDAPDPQHPQGGARLRVLPGPQAELFDVRAFEALHHTRFTISPQSNRMGYRLTGASFHQPRGDMISDATFTGAVQVPASGEPILLMADRQTVGGYPQIAIVITADLPLAAQLAPGDWIEFVSCTRDEAIDALAAQRRQLTPDA